MTNLLNRINIFDFDDTLFRVPNFTCSEAAGMSPHQWYDDPKSLTPPVNPIGITNIIHEARGIFGKNYLITHRVPECKDEIIKLLAKHDCVFTEMFFLARASNKIDTVIELIVNESDSQPIVAIYEDSLWELIKYSVLPDRLLELNVSVKFINYIFVDKSKIISIPAEALTLMRLNSYVERIILA